MSETYILVSLHDKAPLLTTQKDKSCFVFIYLYLRTWTWIHCSWYPCLYQDDGGCVCVRVCVCVRKREILGGDENCTMGCKGGTPPSFFSFEIWPFYPLTDYQCSLVIIVASQISLFSYLHIKLSVVGRIFFSLNYFLWWSDHCREQYFSFNLFSLFDFRKCYVFLRNAWKTSLCPDINSLSILTNDRYF